MDEETFRAGVEATRKFIPILTEQTVEGLDVIAMSAATIVALNLLFNEQTSVRVSALAGALAAYAQESDDGVR